MAKLASTVCATGGGAYKFADLIESEVKMNLHKFDEIDSLVRGVEYMETNNKNELYYYDNPQVSFELQSMKTKHNLDFGLAKVIYRINSLWSDFDFRTKNAAAKLLTLPTMSIHLY